MTNVSTAGQSGVMLIGWTEVEAVVQRLRQSGAQTNRIMEVIAHRIQTIQLENMDSAQDSGGAPWPALKPVTLARRRQRGAGAKMLQDNLILRNSIVADWSSKEALAGTASDYAQVHQEGTEKIPQREFMYLTSAQKRELVNMLTNDTIKRALVRGGQV